MDKIWPPPLREVQVHVVRCDNYCYRMRQEAALPQHRRNSRDWRSRGRGGTRDRFLSSVLYLAPDEKDLG